MDDPSKIILLGLLILATGQLLIPVAIILGLLRGRPNSRLDWFLRVLSSGSFVLFALLAHLWLLCPVFSDSGLSNFYCDCLPEGCPTTIRHRQRIAAWVRTAALVLAVVVFGPPSVLAFGAFRHPGDPVDLTFPLRQGVYEVGQGGSNRILNRHYDSERPGSAQQYALDIGKLNWLSTRAWGLYPRRLERYAIFGDTVVSPCSGLVLDAVNHLPDLMPPNADRQNLAGNHVQVECKGVHVLLAHLRRGSVRVSAGESLQEGQLVAQVGNSGNTSEPHLHIHATRDGRGVPMLFRGRFLVRNNLIVSR